MSRTKTRPDLELPMHSHSKSYKFSSGICDTEESVKGVSMKQNNPKPPRHPSQIIHLPQISSPNTRKPKFSILFSPNSKGALESSLGIVSSSLTPNGQSRKQKKSDGFISARLNKSYNQSAEHIKKSPEQDQFNLKIEKSIEIEKKSRKNIFKDHPEYTNKSYDSSKLPEITSESIRKIVVPDIPKAAFGVHKTYNELNVKEDFKIVCIDEKPRAPRFRSRSETLSKEAEIREKILKEIILENQKKPLNNYDL